MRKTLSLILAALMLMSIIPFALAEDVPEPERMKVTKISVFDAETTPTAGRTAGSMRIGSVTVNDGISAATFGHSYWWDCTNYVAFYDDEVFEEGNSYQHVWTVKLDGEYIFADELEIELNGRTDNIEMFDMESDCQMYFWSMPEEAENDGMLHSVQIENADTIPVINRSAGELKKADITADGGNSFTVKEDVWNRTNDDNSEVPLADEEIFKQYGMYFRSFVIEPGEGLSFSENTWVTINGEDALCSVLEDGTLRTQTALCEATEYIEITTVTVEEVDPYPVENDTAEDHTSCILPYGARYSIFSAKWFCNDDSTYLAEDDVFVAGRNYSFEITLIADSDYLFAEEAEVFTDAFEDFIDREKTGIDVQNHANFHVWTMTVECEKLPEVIDTVEITDIYYPPVLGEKPTEHLSCTLPEDAHYTLDFTCWFDDTTGMRMKDDDVYTVGHSYSMGIFLIAEEGYVFDDDTTATLNGGTDIIDKDASGYDSWEPNNYYIWTSIYEFTEEDTEIISDVSVSDFLTEPVAGSTAGAFSSFTLPEDSHYSVFRVTWYNMETEDNMASDDVFLAGEEYFAEIAIVADVGYSFDTETKLSLNGGTDFDADYSGFINNKVVRIVTNTVQVKAPQVGDLNCDSKINTADAVVVLKYAAEMVVLDENQLAAGDTNHDGKVNTADAVLILKYAAGMISEF